MSRLSTLSSILGILLLASCGGDEGGNLAPADRPVNSVSIIAVSTRR